MPIHTNKSITRDSIEQLTSDIQTALNDNWRLAVPQIIVHQTHRGASFSVVLDKVEPTAAEIEERKKMEEALRANSEKQDK